MAKKTFYFPHDGNARNDEKLLAVRMKHGMEGYGVYFAILERLLESSDYMCVKEYSIIGFDLRVSAELIKNIVEDFGLFYFTEDEKCFFSDSLNKRMKPLENMRQQRSLAGKKSAEKRLKNNESLTVVQRSLPEKATEESRVKKSKEDNNSNSLELPCETSQPHVENINYENLIKFFNSETKGVFGIVRYPISDTRKKHIRARVREHGKETFIAVIKKACESGFLKGDKTDFKMTFDWMIKPTNFEKILSGNFDNKKAIESNVNSQAQQTALLLATEIAQRHGK